MQPSRFDPHRITLSGSRLPMVIFTGVAASGSWRRIGWSAGYGVEVLGWAASSDLMAVPASASTPRSTTKFRFDDGVKDYFSPVYVGPATIAAGAPIDARPGKGQWSTVTSSFPAEIVLSRGASWAQLGKVPGIHPPGHAPAPSPSIGWVPASSVILPPGAIR